MNSNQAASVSPKELWTGRVVGALVVVFLLFDCLGHVLELTRVVEWSSATLGFPANTVFGIGITLLVCIILYVIPRTSVLGAILLTGYLGGAVAANVRIGSPLFSHILLPVYLGILLWVAIFLCEGRLRSLIPLKKG